MARLYKSKENKRIMGVCAGLAESNGWDVKWVRLIVILLCCFFGAGVALYVILGLILPYGKMEQIRDDENWY